MAESGLISIQGAAHLCGISPRLFRRWIEEEGILLHRAGQEQAVHWKDFHKCLLKRSLPMPTGFRAGPRVLLIDDEPDELLMLVDTIETFWERAYIGTARDGRGGLKKLLDLRPHLVVTDIDMPGLSGVELCRWARQHPELSHTKILAVTGHHDRRYSRTALDGGADEYLLKPFTPAELFGAVRRLLGPEAFDGGPQEQGAPPS